MFYRRKYYVVNNDFVEVFNKHFIENNLPNQLKYGARLVGRWMAPHSETTTEVFAIWEYDSKEQYEEIELNVRNPEQAKKVNSWYESQGGRERVYKECIFQVKDSEIISTL
ncbi:NIPSNAP family protein [Paenibacillus marchantiae]|uniref:NIPSNAP family protein n=1 Tax=Paenibacillus marchantiae TaxID=3026433 RepID=UPI00237B977F|nr:NIPSNAP family protein [Paenibacillus marchantiae]WDQ35076.1 NIPSNAP family protein [Paenibacillus marchantiae]